jgi:hypothetical protein
MIELSVPHLFSTNKRKVGEVLIRAERAVKAKRDLSCFVLARLPGRFALYERGGAKNPRYKLIPSGLPGHTALCCCEDADKLMTPD